MAYQICVCCSEGLAWCYTAEAAAQPTSGGIEINLRQLGLVLFGPVQYSGSLPAAQMLVQVAWVACVMADSNYVDAKQTHSLSLIHCWL